MPWPCKSTRSAIIKLDVGLGVGVGVSDRAGDLKLLQPAKATAATPVKATIVNLSLWANLSLMIRSI